MAHSLLFARRRHPLGSHTSPSAGVTLAAVVLAGVGACYTSPVNMRPIIKIVQNGTVKRGGVATFMAEVSDPDNDQVRVDWSHKSGRCDTPGTVWAMNTDTYSVRAPDTEDTFCVWAIVEDGNGATARAQLEVDPNNRPPEAILSAALAVADPFFPSSPFPLFRTIRLSALPSSTDPDSDVLTFKWTLVMGPDPEARLAYCDPNNPNEAMRCLTPTVAGRYMVRLTAADPYGGEDSVTEVIEVAPDGLPCLKDTEPPRSAHAISGRADDLQTFTIHSVADDGDPLPSAGELGPPKFVWYMGKVGSELTRQTTAGKNDSVAFHIPGNAFQAGDQVRVRVEVADRDAMRSIDGFTECQDKDNCFSEGQCQQRMTWLVTYDR